MKRSPLFHLSKCTITEQLNLKITSVVVVVCPQNKNVCCFGIISAIDSHNKHVRFVVSPPTCS